MAGKQSIENQHQLFESERDLLKFLPSDMFLVDHQPPPPPSYNNHRHHPSFTFSGRAGSCMDSYGSRAQRTFPVFPSIQHRPPPPQRYPVPQAPKFEQRAGGRPNNRPVYPHPNPAPTQVAPPFRYRAPPPGFVRGTGVYIPRPTPANHYSSSIATSGHAPGKQGGGRVQYVQSKSEVDCLPEDWTY